MSLANQDALAQIFLYLNSEGNLFCVKYFALASTVSISPSIDVTRVAVKFYSCTRLEVMTSSRNNFQVTAIEMLSKSCMQHKLLLSIGTSWCQYDDNIDAEPIFCVRLLIKFTNVGDPYRIDLGIPMN